MTSEASDGIGGAAWCSCGKCGRCPNIGEEHCMHGLGDIPVIRFVTKKCRDAYVALKKGKSVSGGGRKKPVGSEAKPREDVVLPPKICPYCEMPLSTAEMRFKALLRGKFRPKTRTLHVCYACGICVSIHRLNFETTFPVSSVKS